MRWSPRPKPPCGRATASVASAIRSTPPPPPHSASALLRVFRLERLDLGENLFAVVTALVEQLDEAVEHRLHLLLELGGLLRRQLHELVLRLGVHHLLAFALD